uniref:Putative secreted protein n=1 Tax=Anopheles darlingi TaxID=43151 RepID=A0A2M4DEZ5_ANODA
MVDSSTALASLSVVAASLRVSCSTSGDLIDVTANRSVDDIFSASGSLDSGDVKGGSSLPDVVTLLG